MFSLQCMRSLILCAFINLMLCSLYLCFTDFAENNLKYAYVSVEAKEHQHLNTLPQNVNVFEKHLTVHSTPQINSVAHGSFSNAVNETGWAYLEIVTNEKYSDMLQAYGAGVVEAQLTKGLCESFWYNRLADHFANDYQYADKVKEFLQHNVDFLLKSIKENPKDEYWTQVKLLLSQLSGLRDGLYGTVSKPSIKFDLNDPSTFKTIMFQLSGDMEDLSTALGFEKSHVLGSGACSALVKLLPDKSDIYFAHDTWSGYETMLRILKKVTLNYHTIDGNKLPGYQNSYSSYPGFLLSVDDFNLMSSGLATMETTIGSNNNPDLWQYVTPQTVLSWMRVVIADRLAHNAPQWVKLFSKYNSGTYNNQWMVLDYKLFTAGQPLPNNTFMVLEQMPGNIVSGDKSDHINKESYWPSYNIAYFPKIFNISNQQELVDKYGEWFSHEGSPRAKIFKRDHTNVKDMNTMTKIMRYNDFKNDPLSKCNCTPPYSAENSIAARSDLNDQNGTYPFSALEFRNHGATDMKLTNSKLFKTLQFEAISGPTSDQQPVFSWLTAPFRSKVKHRGQPITFNFTSIVHQWKLE